MKTILISIFVFLISFTSCKKDLNNSPETSYEYMHFERAGAGQKVFDLHLTNDSTKLEAVISKYHFRDTSIQVLIDKSSSNQIYFTHFVNALNNKMQIKGTFKQSTLPTGSWSYFYFVSNNDQTEVTNVELRNSLSHFEEIIESKLQ